jgi:hypothetical protein
MIKTTGAISSVLQNSIDGNSRKGSGAAEAPDLEGADQGLRLVDSRGEAGHNATMQQASSLATQRLPVIASRL